MNNEIGRKITSLTLMTIMIAGGMTFALPGAMPVAHAQANANLFVSVEESFSPDRFGGAMVVEVVVNDPDLKDTDETETEPDVTVKGKDVRMVKVTDGLWYGYIADRTQAQLADSLSTSTGIGLDFGTFCNNNVDLSGDGTVTDPIFTDTVGVFVDGVPVGAPAACVFDEFQTGEVGNTDFGTVTNVVREPKSPNAVLTLLGIGQIDVDADAWPFIQLYDFNPTGNVEIKYNKGGGTQTTTLTFDTMDTYSKITLDRTSYTTGSEVQVILTDGALNIDPTDEDSWTFGTNPAATATHYQVFNE